MKELETKLGRPVDPLFTLIELGQGVDRAGEELAAKLVRTNALPATSPLLRELQEVSREQRIQCNSAAARYLYAAQTQTHLTGADDGAVQIDMSKLIADPATAEMIEKLQLQLLSGPADKS